jgi:hypothetical protein
LFRSCKVCLTVPAADGRVRYAKAIKASPNRGPSQDRKTEGKPSSCIRTACALLIFAVGLALCGTAARAAPAGTVVSNTARLDYDVDGQRNRVNSNTVNLIVAERLDVAVIGESAEAPTPSREVPRTVAFLVTNLGNGRENFDLTTAANGAAVLAIVADSNNDGIYDPTIDRPAPDARLPLDAGQTARVFVVVGDVQDAFEVSLTATAVTGSGTPGSVFDGRGDLGGDAVVGQTGATATATLLGGLSDRLRDPTLLKSQSVLAPDGSTRAIKGAIITYRLEARFVRATAAVEIADPIPPGTAFVPGSLALDGIALSDAPDTDPGSFDGGAVGVALGDVSAGLRQISFQVEIL